MKKNVTRKVITCLILSFSILFSSCTITNDIGDRIIEKWTAVNKYFETIYFPKINMQMHMIPSTEETREAYIRLKNFHDVILSLKANITLNITYVSESNRENLTNIVNASNQAYKILEFIYLSDNNLSEADFGQLFAQLHVMMYMLSDEMIVLEYNWSKTFQQAIFSFMQYFMILGIFIAVFAVGLILLTIKESKAKDKRIENSSEFLHYILESQEEERNRISRDLHDTIAQDMRYILSLMGNLTESKEKQAIIEKQKDCINAIRNICYNMAPVDIENKNLADSIKTLCEKFMKTTLIETRCTFTPEVSFAQYNSEQLLNIYRIIQEALSNIQKHANATEATVLFRNTEIETDDGSMKKRLLLIISDDGDGIEQKLLHKINTQQTTLPHKSHFGIRNIKERVNFLKGTVSFNSYPDCGTEVRILLPL